MSKSKTIYICSECGAESPQWMGRCSSCGAYATLEEEMLVSNSSNTTRSGWQSNTRQNNTSTKNARPRISLKFSEIHDRAQSRFESGFGELDRVLGGGIVPGSLVLIGGDPGIGKSTLLLQVANQLSIRLPRILYVSAEESGQQVKLRASRLGVGESSEEAGGRRQEAGGRKQEAGGRRQEAGSRKQEAGGRRQEAGGRR
jgi:DNA repair protein RadA/Sms